MATRHKIRLNQNAKAFIGIIIVLAILAVFLTGFKPAEKAETQMPTPEIPQAPAPEAAPSAPEIPVNETKTVSYTFPGGIPPQLKIVSLINTPTFPKINEVALIRLYVKNLGSDSPATTATLKINGQNVATLDVPAIYRNAQAVLQYNFTATAAGDYTVEAEVAAIPGETVLDDNTAKITITVY